MRIQVRVEEPKACDEESIASRLSNSQSQPNQ